MSKSSKRFFLESLQRDSTWNFDISKFYERCLHELKKGLYGCPPHRSAPELDFRSRAAAKALVVLKTWESFWPFTFLLHVLCWNLNALFFKSFSFHLTLCCSVDRNMLWMILWEISRMCFILKSLCGYWWKRGLWCSKKFYPGEEKCGFWLWRILPLNAKSLINRFVLIPEFQRRHAWEVAK